MKSQDFQKKKLSKIFPASNSQDFFKQISKNFENLAFKKHKVNLKTVKSSLVFYI